MEKMDKEVKEAVKELLEKIPEDKLREAVGGFDLSVKNILICLGLVGFGALSGAGGFYVGQKSDREYDRSKIAEEIIKSQRERMLTQLNEIEEKTKKALQLYFFHDMIVGLKNLKNTYAVGRFGAAQAVACTYGIRKTNQRRVKT